MNNVLLLSGTLGVLLIGAAITLKKSKDKIKELEGITERFKGVIDLEKEKEKIISEADKKVKNLSDEDSRLNVSINKKKGEILDLNGKLSTLRKELSDTVEEVDIQEYGFYKPKYSFPDSKGYKQRLDEIIAKQKIMIKNKTAVICSTEWTVDGNRAKGIAMTNDNIKVILRAFNGECDSAIAKVKYNNVHTMEKRIEKSFEQVNKLNTRNHCSIVYDYLMLKIQELHLNHEYHEKLQEEKEEQKAIKEQMREEEKAQREFERAVAKAQKDEEMAKKALEEAKAQLEKVHGEKSDKLMLKIEELQRKLEEAEANNERAVSMAQMTRSGYVYVISNIGAFGENIYKIGMTRRLEPLDRVRELSSAAVPFKFDVHAMIYSTDAPELENQLHKEFDHKRVNKINNRKEFFKVSIDEIEKSVDKIHGSEFRLTKLAEAREFRETKAMEREELKAV